MDRKDNDLSLLGLDVFVGGPIQHAIQPTGFVDDLKVSISLAINQIQQTGGNVFSAHVAEKFGKETPSFTPEQVSARDFRWMKKCDVFVPILPVTSNGTLLRTDGTHVELGWATALGRPAVIVTKQPFVDSASHLLKGLYNVGQVHTLDLDEFHENPSILIDHVLSATHRQRAAISAGMVG